MSSEPLMNWSDLICKHSIQMLRGFQKRRVRNSDAWIALAIPVRFMSTEIRLNTFWVRGKHPELNSGEQRRLAFHDHRIRENRAGLRQDR
jgi:hypothetical protein